jgi:hypothetical protein
MFKLAKNNSTFNLQKQRRTNRRKIIVVLSVLLGLFATSVVYASIVGTITLQGTLSRSANLSLRLTDAQIVDGERNGEFLTISAADDFRIMHFGVVLTGPGDSRRLTFRVENNGNQAARVIDLYTTDTSYDLTVLWPDDISTSPNLLGTLLVPGSVSDPFEILVEWNPAAVNSPGNTIHSFQIIMDYESAV